MNADDKIFYDKGYTDILNSLLKYFPLRLAFKLYDIQEKEKLKYSDSFTDGLTVNPTTYQKISYYLVYNDFARYSESGNDFIMLTDKGRELIDSGSYEKFVELEKLKRKATITDLKTKKYFYVIEFFKIIIPFALGLLVSKCLGI